MQFSSVQSTEVSIVSSMLQISSEPTKMRRFVQFAVTYIRNIFSIICYGFVHGARSLVVQPTRVYLCPRLHQYRRDNFNGNMDDELYVGTDLVTRPRDLYDRLLECIMQNDARRCTIFSAATSMVF